MPLGIQCCRLIPKLLLYCIRGGRVIWRKVVLATINRPHLENRKNCKGTTTAHILHYKFVNSLANGVEYLKSRQHPKVYRDHPIDLNRMNGLDVNAQVCTLGHK